MARSREKHLGKRHVVRRGLTRRASLALLSGFLLTCGKCSAESRSGVGKPSREDLANFLRGKDAYLRAYAVYNTVYLFPEDSANLVPFVSDNSPWVRRAAVFSLGLLRCEPETNRFIQSLRDPDYGVRRAAVFALGNIGTPKAAAGLTTAFQDDDSAVRQLAVFAAAKVGGPAFVPKITRLLKDESPRVRRAAVSALGILGDPSALRSLKELYRDRKSSQPGPGVAAANKAVEAALKKKVNLDCKFVHFGEMLTKVSETSGVDIRVDDEVLFLLNTSAGDPDNLNSIRLAMWDVPLESAVARIVRTVNGQYCVESGTINITSARYAAYDTPIRLELAAAMALLGDRSAIGELQSLRNHRQFGERARVLLRAIQ
jgi:HEAT repeat protein